MGKFDYIVDKIKSMDSDEFACLLQKAGIVDDNGNLTENYVSVWFHYVDYTGNHDVYSVGGWKAAEDEAISLVKYGFGFCSDETIKAIEDLIESGQWKEAVTLYNEKNCLKEQILMSEGKKVYEP